MGLMYSWATKEYLLWNMTIGQILLYNNKGYDIRNGVDEKKEGLANKSAEELRKLRDNIYAQNELARREQLKNDLSKKYGDIE